MANEEAGSSLQVFSNNTLEGDARAHFGNVHNIYNNVKSRGDRILEQLRFDEMRSWEYRDLEAHPGTLDWLLEDDFDETGSLDSLDSADKGRQARLNARTNFQRWLRKSPGHEVFWFSGRPGSGKSTLVNHLCDHPILQQALQDAMPGAEKIFALKFFAWKAGSTLEKSRTGLWRTLLVQLLEACPDLLRLTQFSIGDSQRQPVSSGHRIFELFILALKNIRDQAGLIIFIDGLDEFQSTDHHRIMEDLKELTICKVCVSSRAVNPFPAAFGGDPDLMIAMHEVNRVDIVLFIREELGMEALRPVHLDPEDLIMLGEEVEGRAEGVFLWVKLAIDTLKEGVSESDNWQSLYNRIGQFPTELHNFIQQIYDSISVEYRRPTAITLLLVKNGPHYVYSLDSGPPFAWLPYIEEMQHDSQFVFSAAIANMREDSEQEVGNVDRTYNPEHHARAEILRKRWSKDMLHVEQDREGALIRFAHRAFFDFFDEKASELRFAAGPEFDVGLSLLQLRARSLKDVQWTHDFVRGFRLILVGGSRAYRALGYDPSPYCLISSSLKKDSDLVMKLFQEIDRTGLAKTNVLQEFCSSGKHWTQALFPVLNNRKTLHYELLPAQVAKTVDTDHRFSASSSGLCLAAVVLNNGHYDLFHLIAKNTRDDPATRTFYLECALVPIFDNAMNRPEGSAKSWLAHLLLAGADINLQIPRECGRSYSVWQRFLYFAHERGSRAIRDATVGTRLGLPSNFEKIAQQEPAILLENMEALLDLGADPNVELVPGHFGSSKSHRRVPMLERELRGDIDPWIPIAAAKAFDVHFVFSKLEYANEEGLETFAKIKEMLENASRKKQLRENSTAMEEEEEQCDGNSAGCSFKCCAL